MKFMLEDIDVVYFCDHTHKNFKSTITCYVVENIKETVIRRYHEIVLFSCVICH